VFGSLNFLFLGLGNFLEQIKSEMEAVEEGEHKHNVDERRQHIEEGDRSDPHLIELDQLAAELEELEERGLLNESNFQPDWRTELGEGEEIYVNSPAGSEIFFKRMNIRKLTQSQRRDRLKDLADQLLKDRITAVPPQVWVLKDVDNSDPDRETDAEEMILSRLGFIFLAYRVDYWWWESVEMTRKFLMTTLLIFIYPRSPAQMACGAMICFFFLLLNIRCAPYCTDGLNSLASFSLVCQFLTLFVGIITVLIDSQGDENTSVGATDKAVTSVLVVAVNCTTVAW
jgi:hypothetical protein